MKPKIKLIFSILPVVLSLLSYSSALAQGKGLVGCTDNCQLGDLVLLVIRIINYLLSLSSFVAMTWIVWSGWNMITAAGNEEKLTTAKKSFSSAVIGFFLVLIAWVLIDAIIQILAGQGFGLNYFFKFIPHS